MPEPINNKASLQLRFQALEDLQDVPAAPNQQFSLDGFNYPFTELTPSSTIPVSRVSYQDYTIGGGGTVDIDLTALASSQTAINGTGKKVQGLIIRNPAGNAQINIAPGATNAYAPFGAGNDVDLFAHASQDGVLVIFQPEGLADIAAGVKNIRITGTVADVVEVGIWLG